MTDDFEARYRPMNRPPTKSDLLILYAPNLVELLFQHKLV